MADRATNRVADYTDQKGIKLSVLASGTGIPEGMLRRSLGQRERDLRAEEFISICTFLEVDPRRFGEPANGGVDT